MTRPSRSLKTQAPAFKHVWKDVFQSERGPTQPMDRAVLFCIYANMDPDGSNCFPPIRLIADWLGRNKDTVNVAITRLTEAGCLQVRVLPGGRGKRHQYFPTIPSGASQWLGQIKEVCPSEQVICPSGSDALCPSGSDLLVHELVQRLSEPAAPGGADSLSEEESEWLPTAEDHQLFHALTDEQKRRIAPSPEFPIEQVSPLCLVSLPDEVKAALRREVKESKEQVA